MPDPVNNNQNLPAGNITGNEQADFQAAVERATAEYLAKQGGGNQQSATPAAPEPISVTHPVTGETLRFNSPAEVVTAMQQLIAANATTQAQLGQLQQQTLPKTEAATPEKFSAEKFAALLEKDPEAGMRYAVAQTLGLGEGDPAAYLKTLQTQAAEANAIKQQLAAYEFRKRRPEMDNFLNTNPQAQTLLLQALQATGRTEITNENLEAAYGIGVAQGVFPPPRQAFEKWGGGQQGNTQGNTVKLPPSLGGNPSGLGSGGIDASYWDRFDSLPLAEQKKLASSMLKQ